MVENKRTMKHILVTVLLVSLLLPACSRRTHASTSETWSLSLSKQGRMPGVATSYSWKDQALLSCRLEIRADSKQVEVPRDVTMVLSLNLVDDNPSRSILTLQVEDLITAQGNRPELWTKPIAFQWVVTKRGRTLSFHQDSDGVPVVLSGLPDLQLLFSRMVPTFPAKKIGIGAVWSRRSAWDLTIPGPTGTGTVEAKDDITYEMANADSGETLVQAKGTTRYQGTMHPVGHMLVIKGQGTFAASARIRNRVFKEATMKADEHISLTTDGHERTVRTQYEARLRCTKPGTATSLDRPPKGQLSQRVVTPKAMAGRHHRSP